MAREAKSTRKINGAQAGRHRRGSAGDASTWLSGPARVSHHLLRFAEALQRDETQALRDIERDVDTEIDEARTTTAPGELLSLQIELATLECARLAQCYARMCADLLDAQASWLMDVEAGAADIVRPWLGDERRISVSDAQALFDPSLDLTPLSWLRAGHKAWREMTKAWLDAIAHDVQGAQAGTSAP